jgi:hypothetical protein
VPIAPDGSALPYPPEAESLGVPGIEDPEYLELIGLLEQIVQREPDPEDSAKLSKLIADLYGLAANRQKEADDAISGKVSQRFLRRNG